MLGFIASIVRIINLRFCEKKLGLISFKLYGWFFHSLVISIWLALNIIT
jgi:hypothetical protein